MQVQPVMAAAAAPPLDDLDLLSVERMPETAHEDRPVGPGVLKWCSREARSPPPNGRDSVRAGPPATRHDKTAESFAAAIHLVADVVAAIKMSTGPESRLPNSWIFSGAPNVGDTAAFIKFLAIRNHLDQRGNQIRDLGTKCVEAS